MGEATRYCPSCGGENKMSYRFCMHCGSPLADRASQSPSAQSGVSPPPPPPPPPPVDAGTPTSTSGEEPPRRRRGYTCAIMAIILLCICGAISAIALYAYGDYLVAWVNYYLSLMGAP